MQRRDDTLLELTTPTRCGRVQAMDAEATVLGIPAFEDEDEDDGEDVSEIATLVDSARSEVPASEPPQEGRYPVSPSVRPPEAAPEAKPRRRTRRQRTAPKAAPIDLRRLAIVVRRRGGRCLLAAVVASLLTALVAPRFAKTKYEATAVVSWLPQSQQNQLAQNMTTFSDSVLLSANLERIAAALGEPREQAAALVGSLSVQSKPMSAVMSIAASTTNPDRSAALANATADVFIESRRQLASSRSVEVAAALRTLLAQREKSLAEAGEKYDEFRRSHRINNLAVEQESAVREFTRLRDLEHDVRIEGDSTRALSAALTAARKSSPELVVMSETLGTTSGSREAAKAQLAKARAVYTEEHPLVRALAAEVEASPQGPESSASSTTKGRNPLRESLTARVEEVRANERSIAEKRRTVVQIVKEAADRVEELAAVESDDARMLADIRVQREQRASLLTQIAQAEQDVRAATSDFVVVARASRQEIATQSRAPRIVFLVGIACLLLALLWEMRPMRVAAAREAAFWLGATPIATTDFPSAGGEKLSALAVDVSIACIEAGAERVAVATVAHSSLASTVSAKLVERAGWDGGSWWARDLSDFCGHVDVSRPEAGTREFVDCGAVAVSERSLRRARRHMDAVLLLVEAGTSVWTLRRLAARLGLEKGSLYVAVVDADPAVVRAVA